MVPLTSLWIPVLLSAVVVFVLSSIIHMVLTYHRNDYRKLPDEDGVMDALRGFNIPPGDYIVPCAGSPEVMKSEAFKAKVAKGPIATMTVFPTGEWGMGRSLVLWFVYCVVVGLFAAYIAGRAVGPGAEYLAVFRFTGCTAFVGYTLAQWQNSIWYRRAWSTTIKGTVDGLIYAVFTAGVFGWLWP
jgi:hypothetical protein